MTNKTINLSQVDQPKGSGSLEFDGLLAAFHAIVWATAEDDDPELAYDEAGNVEAKKLQAMYRSLQAELTKARELLTDVAKTPWMYDVLGSVREYLSNQAAPADKGQGEPVAWIKPDVAKTLTKDECCYAFGSQNPKGTLIPLYAGRTEDK